MAIAIAGRRIDAADAQTPRFPLSAVPLVTDKLENLLRRVRPGAVIASAACGTDLIALEAAGRLGIRRKVVLPFAVGDFRRQSVTDRPGDWGPIYDSVIAAVTKAGDLIELGLAPDNEDAFTEANRVILSETMKLSGPNAAVIVWEGSARGESDLTAHFKLEAERMGLEVFEVTTRR